MESERFLLCPFAMFRLVGRMNRLKREQGEEIEVGVHEE